MPPANDNIASRQTLAGPSGSITPITIDGATVEAGEPSGSNVSNSIHQSIWFKWTAPASGTVTVDTHGSVATDGNGDSFGGLDTTLAAWTASDVTDFATFVEVASNDDDPGLSGHWVSLITFAAVAGTTYYIQVGTFDTPYTGDAHLSWSLAVTPTPGHGTARTLLATGGGGGTSTTITVTHTPAAAEVVHLFWLAEGDSAPQGANGRPDPAIANGFPNSITDSQGGVWAPFTGSPDNLAELGYTSSLGNDGGSYSSSPAPLGVWTGGTWRKLQIGSAIRTSGPPLSAGDTITVNWDAGGGYPDNSSLIAQGFTGVEQTAEGQSQEGFGDVGVQYATGDTQPQTTLASNPYNPTLSWASDYGTPSVLPAPNQAAAFVAAFGAYGATGFTPDSVGSVIATHTEGSLFLAVVFDGSVPTTPWIEPGGTLTGTVPVVAGNYQFIQLAPGTAGGLFAWAEF